MMQRFLGGEPWMYGLCSPLLVTDKMLGGFLELFLGLGLSIAPLPGNFSADALGQVL